MRLAKSEHTARPWRIHEIAPDFEVEDVWALPVRGDRDDFALFLAMLTGVEDAGDVPFLDSPAARLLWRLRDRLGKAFDLGAIDAPPEGGPSLTIPGDDTTTLADRLPEELRHTADEMRFSAVPMRPLYRTEDEFAAEISNRTMHGAMHLSWIARRDGIHQGQMAVLVKPRGVFGRAYMAFIKPFRYAIVYPALLRYQEKAWKQRRAAPSAGEVRP